MLLIRSACDLDNLPAIQACGGLLCHFMKNRMWHDLDDGDKMKFASIRSIPDDFMEIEYETMQALSIFVSDYHPYSSSSRKKEGLSIYGLLNQTMTKRGGKRLKVKFYVTMMNIYELVLTAIFTELDDFPHK